MMINVVKSDGRINESLPFATTNLIILHEFTGRFDSHFHYWSWLFEWPGLYTKPFSAALYLSSSHYVLFLGYWRLCWGAWYTKKVTWLILPVVICLSQRLSHACLSINNFILWNCERLIISAIIYLMVSYYMDNCSNSRANTCVKSRLLRGGMYLLDKKPMRALSGFVVNHSNFSNRMASRRR